MGLLERIKNVVRSNLSDFLERAEDPDKMIGLLIDDMETNLRQARAQIAQMTGEKNHFQRRFREQTDEIDKWDGKARIALKFGNEPLAREALAKKLDLDGRAGSLREQIREIEQTIDDLRLSADSLRSKIENARQKRQELRLQRKREAALQSINASYDALRRVGADPAKGDGTEAVEEAILRAKGAAESADELRQTLYDNRFEKMEREGAVEEALEQLREKVSAEKEQETTTANEDSETTPEDEEVDASDKGDEQ